MEQFSLDNFKLESNIIIGKTKAFDFPFLANEEKKYKMVREKKEYVDKCFDIAISKYSIKVAWPDLIWHESIKHADNEFVSLPEKSKLNGFYLQELMCEYAKRVSEYIIEQILIDGGLS